MKSNAILYARDGQTVGVGAGQMSRVDSCKIGAMKAVLPLKGTVAASDAFFPFPDGVEEIAKAGATAIIQPGGSVRDQEVIEAADRLGLAMIFTGSEALPALRQELLIVHCITSRDLRSEQLRRPANAGTGNGACASNKRVISVRSMTFIKQSRTSV